MISGYSDEARPLTPRMRDVLDAAARGRTVPETARDLYLGASTVAHVRRAALVRLGARNVTEAVVLAIARGEIRAK